MAGPKGAKDSDDRVVFLSHSSADTPQVEALRAALDERGIACFLDVLELKAGDELAATLKEQVQGARALVAVLSPAAVSSKWVQREIEWALAAEDLAAETGGSYRFLPVLTGGITHGFLEHLERPEVLGIDANGRPLADVATDIAQALGVLPVDARPRPRTEPLAPIAELTLDFQDLSFEVRDDKERLRGRVRVEYQPSSGPRGAAVTRDFESPLGAIELGELRWYVETWPGWSFGKERLRRATEVEESLSKWGRELFDASIAHAIDPLEEFEHATGERRIVVQAPARADVEDPRVDDNERARRVAANGAAARLLALPWELLRGPDGFLFEGEQPIRVVRRLPRPRAKKELKLDRRILRVLLLVARTSDAGWIDPRVSLTPLVAALAPLGDRVELVVPPDGSLTALGEALAEADREGRPFHAVHFDGHGVYDRDKGLGLLVFEDDADCAAGKVERKTHLVDAREIGRLLREHRIPLFVLEACQSAQANEQVTSSVAAELVAAGIGSVVAMSHSVLVETARRFVGAFYPALARGERIGTAMVRAQAALALDPDRSPLGLPRWELHDWFVPVLFQEPGGDVRLLPEAGLPLEADVELVQRTARGSTPGAPAHGFVGRDRDLLALSRLLHRHRIVLLRGTGGLGKTALASECARWLLDVQRVRRLAWTSVEKFGSAEAVLQDLGAQVVSGFAVSKFKSLEKARQAVERALRDRPALLVVDNFESAAADPDPELVPLLKALAAVGETRVLVTGREPAPAELGALELHLGALSKREGRTLVEQVLRRTQQAPKEERGEPADASWIDELVEAVTGHPHSLVLLTPMVALRGARVTKQELAPLMAELERRNPGDRENSLLASVRLSLARLEPKQRKQVRALVVFHGGANSGVLARVLQVDLGEALTLAQELVDLGLARASGSYLLLDPALGAAVEGELDAEERTRTEEMWLEACLDWIGFLYSQQSQVISKAVAGVTHALGDLLAVVKALEGAAYAGTGSVEPALAAIGKVEQLLERSGSASALALVVTARKRVGEKLAGWSAVAFDARRLAVERQMQSGDLKGALFAAQALNELARTAGPGSYEGSAYDIALSSNLLAEMLNEAGRADEALIAASDAEVEFRALAMDGDTAATKMAARMAAKSGKLRGDSLGSLGRIEEAAAAYEKAIGEAEALRDHHSAAVSRAQLGNIRSLQGRYHEGIEAYEAARRTFEDLNDPDSVAIAWHQLAILFWQTEQLKIAEEAGLRALVIRTRRGDRTGQASTLTILGVIYHSTDRHEDATDQLRRAARLFAEGGRQRDEGFARNNLASSLYRLSRLTEARAEALSAIQLKNLFGHTAEQWTTWAILSDIEYDLGNDEAAATARQRAIETYVNYRRDGGYAQQQTGQLVAHVTTALVRGASPLELLPQLPSPAETAPNIGAFITCLRAILAGNRDPELLADPTLDYDDVAELTLLLERLARPGSD